MPFAGVAGRVPFFFQNRRQRCLRGTQVHFCAFCNPSIDPIAMGVISNLIKQLNKALGATSIVVTHEVQEALDIVDYVYYLSDGEMLAQGTPESIRASSDPRVRQFVYGESEGPVTYQHPSRPLDQDMRLSA